MRGRRLNVSPEYIESLSSWLLSWADKPTSKCITQFLKEYEIGYPFLKYFVNNNNVICNAYEVAKYKLWCRWFEWAMATEKIPDHQCKILMRYLRRYDSHGLDLDAKAWGAKKAAEKEAEEKTHNEIIEERYGDTKLPEPYDSIVQDNVDKRRSSKEDK